MFRSRSFVRCARYTLRYPLLSECRFFSCGGSSCRVPGRSVPQRSRREVDTTGIHVETCAPTVGYMNEARCRGSAKRGSPQRMLDLKRVVRESSSLKGLRRAQQSVYLCLSQMAGFLSPSRQTSMHQHIVYTPRLTSSGRRPESKIIVVRYELHAKRSSDLRFAHFQLSNHVVFLFLPYRPQSAVDSVERYTLKNDIEH